MTVPVRIPPPAFTTTAVTVVTTTEKVALTLAGISTDGPSQRVSLVGWVQFTPGAACSSVSLAIRRGTAITDTLVGVQTASISGAPVQIRRYSATLSPASVAASTCAEQIFAVTGPAATDILVAVQKPANQAGLGIAGGRVSSAGNIAINFVNASLGAIVPTAAEAYDFAVLTPSGGTVLLTCEEPDTPGEVASQSYVLTVQQTGATGNGSVVAAYLQAILLG